MSWSGEAARVVKGANPWIEVLVGVVFAALWLGMMSLVTALGWDQIANATGLKIFMALFWAAGIFLAGLAVRAMLHAIRFGRSTLVLDAVPARLGGWLSGVVRAPLAVEGADVQLSVECSRSGQSSRSSSSRSVMWRLTKVLDGTRCPRGADGIEAPFAFRLPTSEEATREINERLPAILAVPDVDLIGEGVHWWVAVTARLPGVDFRDRFAVPVAAAQPGPVASSPPRAMPELSGERLVEHMPARLDVELDADVFVFPLKASWVAWPLAFALIAVAGLLARYLPVLSDLPEAAVFWTALACGILAGLSVAGLMLDTRRIEIRPQKVRIRRGAFGVGFHRTLPRAAIAEVEEETSTSDPPSYSVNIRMRNGKRYWAMAHSPQKERAAALAARLRQVLQLS